MAEPSSNADDAKLRLDATEIKFILFLLKEVVDGNAPYNWATVTDKFNDISEKSYSLKQISGKYSRLKKRYVAFTHLMGRDDMKYDYRTNTFKGKADAWAKTKGASVIHLFNFHAVHSLNSSCKQSHIYQCL